MTEVIAFPDVEDLLVTYLGSALPARGDAATVHVTVPDPRPERFVLVPRVGGAKRNLVVDSPTIGLECWAATPGQAYDLCRLTRALVHALPGQTIGGVAFYNVEEFAGPANLPDGGLSGQSRYILTVAVSCRGTAI